MDPEKKSLNFIFPTKYVIPKSLKFSHWLSEMSSFLGWEFQQKYVFASDSALKLRVFGEFLKAQDFRTVANQVSTCCMMSFRGCYEKKRNGWWWTGELEKKRRKPQFITHFFSKTARWTRHNGGPVVHPNSVVMASKTINRIVAGPRSKQEAGSHLFWKRIGIHNYTSCFSYTTELMQQNRIWL